MSADRRTVLFEPWHLGDAIIAAATLREAAGRLTLACASRWHEILRTAMPDLPGDALLAADLRYTGGRADRFRFERHAPLGAVSAVLSIRGDPRDVWAAHSLFPGASLKVTGFPAFVARRMGPVDLPYASGLLPVRNRYTAWEAIAGLEAGSVSRKYAHLRRTTKAYAGRIAIFCGARYVSKRYPSMLQVAALLEASGFEVDLIGGSDEDVAATFGKARILRDRELVAALSAARYLIANDTGPMHLGALVGCVTLVVNRISSFVEWRPPGCTSVNAAAAPRGYRPRREYLSATTVGGWPPPALIAEVFLQLAAGASPAAYLGGAA